MERDRCGTRNEKTHGEEQGRLPRRAGRGETSHPTPRRDQDPSVYGEGTARGRLVTWPAPAGPLPRVPPGPPDAKHWLQVWGTAGSRRGTQLADHLPGRPRRGSLGRGVC